MKPFLLILSFLFAASAFSKTRVYDSVLIGYLKYLRTKLLVNNKLMSHQDERILEVVLEMMTKRNLINEESFKRFDRLLKPILLRRQKSGDLVEQKEISKHMH